MSLIVFTMINLVGDPVDMLVNPESLPEEIAVSYTHLTLPTT